MQGMCTCTCAYKFYIKMSYFQANEDITQIVEVLPVGPAKWTWLIKRLVEFTTSRYNNQTADKFIVSRREHRLNHLWK